MQAQLCIDAHARIGEAPVWDAKGQRLLWTDHEAGILYQVSSNGAGGWKISRQWSLGAPLAAAVPCGEGRLLVAAGQTLFYLGAQDERVPLARLPETAGTSWINEVKTDRRGRLWVGTLAGDFKPGGGALYRLDGPEKLSPVLTGVTVSNGMDWSPAGDTFYYIDSVTLAVDAFNYDCDTGELTQRRRLIDIEFGAGAPDGLTVDADGCLWVAVAAAGEVRRYSPGGQLLSRVTVSAPAVTSCAFGGDRLEDLFITSLGRRLPDAFLALGVSPATVELSASAPGAGGLFVCRPGTRGIMMTELQT